MASLCHVFSECGYCQAYLFAGVLSFGFAGLVWLRWGGSGNAAKYKKLWRLLSLFLLLSAAAFLYFSYKATAAEIYMATKKEPPNP